MNKIHLYTLLLVISVFFPGCGCRIIDWARSSVCQGTVLPDNCSKPRSWVRSIKLYDQCTLLAIFDVLWLSDAVRTAYASLLSVKTGKSEEQQTTITRRQLAENEHSITFYVLSMYEVPLREKDSAWSITLDIDGCLYAPIEVKSIDLSPEYQAFFGTHYNQFKIPYQVQFNARDINNRLLVTEETRSVRLLFRSVEREGSVGWCFAPKVNS